MSRLATCNNCLTNMHGEDALYDDYEEQYFCCEECFLDWCDDHSEEVNEYYGKMNVSGRG